MRNRKYFSSKKFSSEQVVDIFADVVFKANQKMSEEVDALQYGELYAIGDLLMKEYEKAGKCLACETGSGYCYNFSRIACLNNHLIVANSDKGIVTLRANYCHVCGKKLK